MSIIVGNYITPNKIPNLTLWLEADQGVTSTTSSFVPSNQANAYVTIQDNIAVFASDRNNLVLSGDIITSENQTFTVISTGSYYFYVTPSANPSVGTSQSLEPRRNLMMGTEEFNNTTLWTPSDITISANITTSPIGTNRADLIYPSTSSTSAYDSYNTFLTGSVCFSIYAKAGGYNWMRLFKFQSPTSAIADFDLQNGVVGYTNGITSSSIQDVGSGWYRCAMFFNALGTSTTNIAYRAQIISASNVTSVAPDGTKGIYVWGAQLETGSAISAYQAINTGSSYTIRKAFPRVINWANIATVANTDFTGSTGILGEYHPVIVTSSINTRPTLVFDRNDFLTNTSSVWDFLHNTGSSGGTIITVTQLSNNGRSYILGNNFNSDSRIGYLLSTNQNGTITSYISNGSGSADAARVSYNTTATALPTDNFIIISDTVLPSGSVAANRSKLFTSNDGAITSLNTSSATPTSQSRSSGFNMQIGGRGSTPLTAGDDRKIAALLIYSRALSDEERRAVEYYLSVKYAVPLRVGLR